MEGWVGGVHTRQCADDALEDCTLETYIILFTNVIAIHLGKI